MSIIQFLGLSLSFAAILKVVADQRKKKESQVMFVFWLTIWVGVAVFTIYPGIVDILLAKVLGPKQSIGTVLGFGMVVLLFLIYRLYVKMERVERALKKYVTDLALKELKNKIKE